MHSVQICTYVAINIEKITIFLTVGILEHSPLLKGFYVDLYRT